MRKLFLVLLSLAVMTGVALADNGLGIFGTYWDTEDLGGGFGGGIKFRGDLGDLFGVDLRASCVTQLDDWEGDDDLYLIPLEALLLFRGAKLHQGRPQQQLAVLIDTHGGSGAVILFLEDQPADQRQTGTQEIKGKQVEDTE